MRNISRPNQYFPLILLLCSAFFYGCTHTATAEPEPYLSLESARSSAIKKNLELQTLQIVQEVANELKTNRLRLSLSSLIIELRNGKHYLIEHDPRLRLLTNAMEYLTLLRKNPQVDAVEYMRPWAASKMRFKSACDWSELNALEQLPHTIERDQQVHNLRLTLALSLNMRVNNLPPFDYSSLAAPEPPPPPWDKLPELSRIYKNDPAAPLRFAQLLFRLSDELRRRELSDENFDARGPINAALHIAATLRLEITGKYLAQAYKNWRITHEELKKNGNSPQLKEREILTKLRWRHAYYRYELDSFALMSCTPGTQEDRNMIFDLAVLQ